MPGDTWKHLETGSRLRWRPSSNAKDWIFQWKRGSASKSLVDLRAGASFVAAFNVSPHVAHPPPELNSGEHVWDETEGLNFQQLHNVFSVGV